MNIRTTHLKIKIKYLACESRIIRHEERRILEKPGDYEDGYNADYESLYRHRKDVVSREARHCLLAYAFLRGRPYSQVEQHVREDNHPKWKKVRELAKRFSTDLTDFDEHWDDWLNEAQEHLTTITLKAA